MFEQRRDRRIGGRRSRRPGQQLGDAPLEQRGSPRTSAISDVVVATIFVTEPRSVRVSIVIGGGSSSRP